MVEQISPQWVSDTVGAFGAAFYGLLGAAVGYAVLILFWPVSIWAINETVRLVTWFMRVASTTF
jgi:hypothetical protein